MWISPGWLNFCEYNVSNVYVYIFFHENSANSCILKLFTDQRKQSYYFIELERSRSDQNGRACHFQSPLYGKFADLEI